MRAAAAPAMAGALGSTGVASLAPLSMRLAERCDIDRRMVGLMVVHGAAAGNFSPLNVLGALVHREMTTRGLEMSAASIFWSNLGYNLALAAIIFVWFGGRRLIGSRPAGVSETPARCPSFSSWHAAVTSCCR